MCFETHVNKDGKIIRTKGNTEDRKYKPFKFNQKFGIDDIEVEPYRVDHSLSGATGATRSQGLAGAAGASRYVIEGSFNVTQDGELIELWYEGTEARHYKRIDIPQLTLSDMPSVQVYVKTYVDFVQDEPIEMWKLHFPEWVRFDEGCVFFKFKTHVEYYDDLFTHAWVIDTGYDIDGNYKIVVVK